MKFSFNICCDLRASRSKLDGIARGIPGMAARLIRCYASLGAILLSAVLCAAPAVAGGFSEKIIHIFTGGADGQYPNSTLTPGPLGVFYGTTPGGGTACGTSYGCGVVFEIIPPSTGGGAWRETVIYQFQGGNDGAFPNSSKLLLASDGSLYGVTLDGGTSGNGTVFHLVLPAGTPTWTETAIYNFTGGADGGNPQTDLVADSNGVLYGTTTAGGRGCGGAGCGTVFSLTPPAKTGGRWALKTLHAFAGGNDGAVPISGVTLAPTGQVFGTTTQGGSTTACGGAGCGVVFELTPPAPGGKAWAETLIHKFVLPSFGATAYGSLYLDGSGNLFGATTAGGTYGCGTPPLTGCGTTFLLSPPAPNQNGYIFKRLHDESGGIDGSYPNGDLAAGAGGVLAGTTYGGGYDCPVCAGTVFELVPPSPGGTWAQTGKYLFKGPPTDGSGPSAGVVAGTSGSFIGTTGAGGSTGLGTVFEIIPTTPAASASR
jgi:uncharacterized repeat protein (TIGR03803 family)